jgi:ribosome maturation factor RimP
MTTKAKVDQKIGKIADLARDAASPLGFEVLSVTLGQQGKYGTLEICIFRKRDAISLSDCEKVSRAVDELLERENEGENRLFNGPYLLDVVSPGIDRRLTNSRDFALFAGEKVRIKTKDKIGPYGDDFIGTLVGGSDEEVRISDPYVLKAGRGGSQKSSSAASKRRAEAEGDRSTSEDIGETHKELTINLAGVFKINLHAEDLKKS